MNNSNPILVKVTRGEIAESFHRGAVAVVDSEGNLTASIGNYQITAFLRSSAKPFQVIPLITSGAAKEFGFTAQEIALMCGSHNGESTHTELMADILQKIGLNEEYLKCGIHPPLDDDIRKTMRQKGEPFTQLHNNCSAKHAAMLAGSVFRGYPLDDYQHPEHPWQREIIKTLAEIANVKPWDILLGIDGCGVPVHALPLYNAAWAGARLAFPEGLNERISFACAHIFQAMAMNPYMVAGKNRICTELIRAGKGDIAAKSGAEGFYLISYKKNGKGYGIALKIDDGAERACNSVVIETLAQLEILKPEDISALNRYHKPQIVNHTGIQVGAILPDFKLLVHNS